MVGIVINDLYRFGKSKLLYGVIILTVGIALFLTMLIGQDIRLGISVYGNLVAFRGFDDIVRIGLTYNNGLGIFVAVLLSVFIGQEYQWKTWQHKWLVGRSRVSIYLSKAVLSSVVSSLIFVIFQAVVLLSSNQTGDYISVGYIGMVLCGIAIYAALGAVICMLSMLIKNSTTSVIVCLLYVLAIESLASLLGNLASISETSSLIVGWLIRHSIYGMVTVVSESVVTWSLAISIFINSILIMLLSFAIVTLAFRRYEL